MSISRSNWIMGVWIDWIILHSQVFETKIGQLRTNQSYGLYCNKVLRLERIGRAKLGEKVWVKDYYLYFVYRVYIIHLTKSCLTQTVLMSKLFFCQFCPKNRPSVNHKICSVHAGDFRSRDTWSKTGLCYWICITALWTDGPPGDDLHTLGPNGQHHLPPLHDNQHKVLHHRHPNCCSGHSTRWDNKRLIQFWS